MQINIETLINDFIENNKKYYPISEAGIQSAAIDGFCEGLNVALTCINNLLKETPKRQLTIEEAYNEASLRG